MSTVQRLVTGDLVDTITLDLVTVAADPDEKVRELNKEGLLQMGRKKPVMTISTIIWGISQKNVDMAHRIILLKILDLIIRENLDAVQADLASTIASFSANELTSDKEIKTDWQVSACKILISIAGRYPELVYDQLIKRMPQGKLPHYFVVYALIEFAKKNPTFIVTKLKEIFSRMLPLVGGLKQDNLRWVFSGAFGMFAHAVLTTEEKSRRQRQLLSAQEDEEENEGDGEIDENAINTSGLFGDSSSSSILHLYSFPVARPTTTFDGEMDTAFSIMFNSWITIDKCRQVCVEAIGRATRLMTPQTFQTNLPKLLPLLLKTMAKDPLPEKFPSVSALHATLMVSLNLNPRDLLPHLPIILQSTFGLAASLQPLFSTAFLFPPEPNKWKEISMRVASGEGELTEEDIEEETAEDDGARYIVAPSVEKEGAEPLELSYSQRLTAEIQAMFGVIALDYIEEVVVFLLKQIEQAQGNARAVALCLLTHIVTVLPSHIEIKRGLIIASLGHVANDSTLSVRFALLHLILTLSRYNFLDETGWENLIAVVISSAGSYITPWNDPAAVNKAGENVPTVQAMSEFAKDVLYEMVVHHSEMKGKLWPHIFEYIVKLNCTGSIPTICAAVVRLAAGRKARNGSEDILIDFDERIHANLPRPHAILLRCITLLSDTQLGPDFAIPILAMLNITAPTLHYSLTDICSEKIPPLVAFYEECFVVSETDDENGEEEQDEHQLEAKKREAEAQKKATKVAFNRFFELTVSKPPKSVATTPEKAIIEKWEHRAAGLFAAFLDAIADDDWLSILGDQFHTQFPLYPPPGAQMPNPAEKRDKDAPPPIILPAFLYNRSNGQRILIRLLGVCVQQTEAKQFASTLIDLMFTRTSHSDESHRQALAEGLGLAGKNPIHVDTVYIRLDSAIKNDMLRKEKSVFSSKVSTDERVLSSILLSLGRVSLSANPSIALSRIEAHVLPVFNQYLPTLTSFPAKMSGVSALDCVCRAVNPSRIPHQFILKQRDEYIKIVLDYIFPRAVPEKERAKSAAEPGRVNKQMQNQLILACLNVLKKLVALPPIVPETLQKELVTRLTRLYETDDPTKDKESEEGEGEGDEEAEEELSEDDEAYIAITNAHSSLLVALQGCECSIDMFLRLCSFILPLTRSQHPNVRKGALSSFDAIIRAFVQQTADNESAREENEEQTPSKNSLGQFAKERRFLNLGVVLSVLIPRTADERVDARKAACDVVGLSLYVDHILRTDPSLGFDVSPTEEIVDVALMRKSVVKFSDTIIPDPLGEKEKSALPNNAWSFFPATQNIAQSPPSSQFALSHTISKRLSTHLAHYLPLDDQVDLITSLARLSISDPTLQGAVLAANLAKELILIAGNSFPTSAVQTVYNTLIDAITPYTLNPPLQGKETRPQVLQTFINQQSAKHTPKQKGENETAKAWVVTNPDKYVSSCLYSPTGTLAGCVESELLDAICALSSHHANQVFEMTISLPLSHKSSAGKIALSIATSKYGPSDQFMSYCLNIICGPEQYEPKHIKGVVHYFPLPKPQLAVNVINSVFAAPPQHPQNIPSSLAKHEMKKAHLVSTKSTIAEFSEEQRKKMPVQILDGEFLEKHLPSVIGSLLVELATLIVCENNTDPIRGVLSTLRGIMHHCGVSELVETLQAPPLLQSDQFDKIVDAETIAAKEKQARQAAKNAAPQPQKEEKKKDKKDSGSAVPEPVKIQLPPYNLWQSASDKQWFNVFTLAYSHHISSNHPFIIPACVDILTPLLSSTFPAQRLGAVSILTGLVPHMHHHPSLVPRTLDALLGRTTDENVRIRSVSLQGLSHLPLAAPDTISNFCAPALAAACRACDDQNEEVAQHAATCCRRLVNAERLTDVAFSPMLLTACVAARNLISQRALTSYVLRGHGLALIASISKFSSGAAGGQYIEQFHTALPYISIMLADKFPICRQAARLCMAFGVQALDAPPLASFCSTDVFTGDTDITKDLNCSHTLFTTLAKLLIALFTVRLGSYTSTLTSFLSAKQPPSVKIAGTQLLGFILQHLPKSERSRVSPEQSVKAICALLKDPSSLVRTTASNTLYSLWDY
ncbi:putative Protein SHOOT GRAVITROPISM 6 [Blattamonas nauphoetae]|uniref:Uncharacterized protein n=1 Tax=Blattamonas nauphoetae TaxID=2049346 RepID=A0ABQ9XMQ7_9EUKA|nr:putative Protein SHOOT GRAVITROPISM 6 [Blattamonas nauphoetae]